MAMGPVQLELALKISSLLLIVIPWRNANCPIVGLDVERKTSWRASPRASLVYSSHRRFLRCHWPSRRIRSEGQIVGENLPPFTVMSVRELLTFNLFLQVTDGFVSYQAFALGAVEANPVVAAAIINWGMVWGLIYNKALACLLLLLIFALRRNRRLLATRSLTVTASVYVCAIFVCLWQLFR